LKDCGTEPLVQYTLPMVVTQLACDVAYRHSFVYSSTKIHYPPFLSFSASDRKRGEWSNWYTLLAAICITYRVYQDYSSTKQGVHLMNAVIIHVSIEFGIQHCSWYLPG